MLKEKMRYCPTYHDHQFNLLGSMHMCLCLTALQTYLVMSWICSTFMTAQYMMWCHQMHQAQIFVNQLTSVALHCMAPNPLFACMLLNGLMALSHPYLVRLIKVIVGFKKSPSLQCRKIFIT
jgi:hypothetical protein